jgi:hypothetical protein
MKTSRRAFTKLFVEITTPPMRKNGGRIKVIPCFNEGIS